MTRSSRTASRRWTALPASLAGLVLAPVALASCSGATSPNAPRPRDSFVTVAPDVRLHFIDHGGSGPPLVLLAGLGNTAHVFRSLAPELAERFRVIALTRRGFGASSQPPGGYDTRTLSEDVRVVLDSLGLQRVHLVGHSIAGDEMTRFAGDHPERVSKLVYLDAGYDRVALGELMGSVSAPPPPPPGPADIGSLAAFGAYVERVRGVRLPVEELRATFVFGPTGTLLRPVTPDRVTAAVLAGEEAPDYSRVRAPALGIYAVPTDPADVLPWLTPSSPEWAESQAFLDGMLGPFYDAQRARFDSEVATSTLLELPGANHYLFLSDPGRVADAIREFLLAP